MSSRVATEELFEMLNIMYTAFDALVASSDEEGGGSRGGSPAGGAASYASGSGSGSDSDSDGSDGSGSDGAASAGEGQEGSGGDEPGAGASAAPWDAAACLAVCSPQSALCGAGTHANKPRSRPTVRCGSPRWLYAANGASQLT